MSYTPIHMDYRLKYYHHLEEPLPWKIHSSHEYNQYHQSQHYDTA